MTDKERIRKEVERLRSLYQMKYQQLDADNSMSLVECGKRNLCNELLSFIDSLQEEPVSEDLEEAANKYSSCAYLEEVLSDDDKEVLKDRLKNTFKAGVEWHKNTKRSNENLDEAAWLYYDRNKPITPPGLVLHKEFISFFKAGANWKKQQMMKNTVDAVCYVTHYEDETQVAYSVSYPKGEETNKYHDKVKLIIIKEDYAWQ